MLASQTSVYQARGLDGADYVLALEQLQALDTPDLVAVAALPATPSLAPASALARHPCVPSDARPVSAPVGSRHMTAPCYTSGPGGPL